MKTKRTFAGGFSSAISRSKTKYEMLIRKACRDANSPYSLKIYLLVKNGEWNQALYSDVKPEDYLTSRRYYLDAQVHALIKKYPYLDVDVNPREEAMRSFIKAEIACKETNDRFRANPDLHLEGHAVRTIFRLAQRKIGELLGDCPKPESLSFEFGPGANLGVSKYTSSYHKLKSSLDVTYKGVGTALSFLSACPGWAHALACSPHCEFDLYDRMNIVPGNRLSFVPKTAKTDRPICIEPLLNGIIQKGIGSKIRTKLRERGLDLKTAQKRHRLLAKQSSIDDSLATVDLSAASDTISYLLVMNLLPYSWFKLLDSVRSPQYTIQGQTYSFQKFSSMGNGYTFELESLIFLALSRATMDYCGAKGVCSVYGDDIIIPAECSEMLYKVLEACGFTVNAEKSFPAGPFKESCGGDFFSGIDVRPFFLKDKLSNQKLFLLRNYFVRSGHEHYFPQLMNYIDWLLGEQTLKKFAGPNVEGDGHLVDVTRSALAPYKSIYAKPINLTAKKHDRMYGAFALYRQMFSGFPLMDGLFEAYASTRTGYTNSMNEVVSKFEGHPVRGRYRYRVTTIRPICS
jgi:hypothetical protein